MAISTRKREVSRKGSRIVMRAVGLDATRRSSPTSLEDLDRELEARGPTRASRVVPREAPSAATRPSEGAFLAEESARATGDAPSEKQASDIVARGPEPAPEGPLQERLWFVWVDGGEPVGPVSADQIGRGMKAGKVPADARVRKHTDIFWSDVLDIPEVIEALKHATEESVAPPSPERARLLTKEWLVWVDGSDEIGPVSADQIARGIRAGRVPSDASIRRIDDFFAADVLDEPDIIAALKAL